MQYILVNERERERDKERERERERVGNTPGVAAQHIAKRGAAATASHTKSTASQIYLTDTRLFEMKK